MDNIRFGAFVAQLRKEQGLTQKELADRLNVTDKAVSKWETGKGFPDVKLLEPLAQALGISLVELIRGEKDPRDSLTAAEAEAVVSQAMDQSQRITARRYLKLLRWLLTSIAAICAVGPLTQLALALELFFTGSKLFATGTSHMGHIGGVDGPTSIFVSSAPLPTWLSVGLPTLLLVLCIILAFRVWKLERKVK